MAGSMRATTRRSVEFTARALERTQREGENYRVEILEGRFIVYASEEGEEHKKRKGKRKRPW